MSGWTASITVAVRYDKKVGQTVRAALMTWHGTARLCAALLCIAVVGAVFLFVVNTVNN